MGNNTYVGIKFTEDCEQFKLTSRDKFNLKYVPFSPLHAEMNLYRILSKRKKGAKKEKLAVLYTKFKFTQGMLLNMAGAGAAFYPHTNQQKSLLNNMGSFKRILTGPNTIEKKIATAKVATSMGIWGWILILRPVFRMKSFEQNLIVSAKLAGKSKGNTFVFFLCSKKVKNVTLSYEDDDPTSEGWYLIYQTPSKIIKHQVRSQTKQKTNSDDYAMLGSVNFNVNAPKVFPTPVVVMSQYIVQNMNRQVIGIAIRNALKRWKEKTNKNKQSKNH